MTTISNFMSTLASLFGFVMRLPTLLRGMNVALSPFRRGSGQASIRTARITLLGTSEMVTWCGPGRLTASICDVKPTHG
jgi:hypothetical protein